MKSDVYQRVTDHIVAQRIPVKVIGHSGRR